MRRGRPGRMTREPGLDDAAPLKPVDAVVALPGSKSITARALIPALADGPSRCPAAARPRHRPHGRRSARLGVGSSRTAPTGWSPRQLRGRPRSTPAWPACPAVPAPVAALATDRYGGRRPAAARPPQRGPARRPAHLGSRWTTAAAPGTVTAPAQRGGVQVDERVLADRLGLLLAAPASTRAGLADRWRAVDAARGDDRRPARARRRGHRHRARLAGGARPDRRPRRRRSSPTSPTPHLPRRGPGHRRA